MDAMDMFHIGSQVGFNIAIAMFLYVALAHEIGQVRKDIRRLPKRSAPAGGGHARTRG